MNKNKKLSFYFSLLFLGCFCFFLRTATVEFANKSSVIALKGIAYLRTNDNVTGWNEFSVLKNDAGVTILSAGTTLTYGAALTDLIINNSNAVVGGLADINIEINNVISSVYESVFGFQKDTSGYSWEVINAGAGNSAWAVEKDTGDLYELTTRDSFAWTKNTNAPFDTKTALHVSVSKYDSNYVAAVANDHTVYYSINGGSGWTQIGAASASTVKVAIGSSQNCIFFHDTSKIYYWNGSSIKEIAVNPLPSLTPGAVYGDIDVAYGTIEGIDKDVLWLNFIQLQYFYKYYPTLSEWRSQWIQTNEFGPRYMAVYDNNLRLVIDDQNTKVYKWSHGIGLWKPLVISDQANGDMRDVGLGNPKNAWFVDSNYSAFATSPDTSLEDRVETLEESNTHTHNIYITESIRFGGVLLGDGSIERSGDIVFTDPGIRVPPGYEDVVVEVYG